MNARRAATIARTRAERQNAIAKHQHQTNDKKKRRLKRRAHKIDNRYRDDLALHSSNESLPENSEESSNQNTDNSKNNDNSEENSDDSQDEKSSDNNDDNDENDEGDDSDDSDDTPEGSDFELCAICARYFPRGSKKRFKQKWCGCDFDQEHWIHEECLTKEQLREAKRKNIEWKCPVCIERGYDVSSDEHDSAHSRYSPTHKKKKKHSKKNFKKITKPQSKSKAVSKKDRRNKNNSQPQQNDTNKEKTKKKKETFKQRQKREKKQERREKGKKEKEDEVSTDDDAINVKNKNSNEKYDQNEEEMNDFAQRLNKIVGKDRIDGVQLQSISTRSSYRRVLPSLSDGSTIHTENEKIAPFEYNGINYNRLNMFNNNNNRNENQSSDDSENDNQNRNESQFEVQQEQGDDNKGETGSQSMSTGQHLRKKQEAIVSSQKSSSNVELQMHDYDEESQNNISKSSNNDNINTSDEDLNEKVPFADNELKVVERELPKYLKRLLRIYTTPDLVTAFLSNVCGVNDPKLSDTIKEDFYLAWTMYNNNDEFDKNSLANVSDYDVWKSFYCALEYADKFCIIPCDIEVKDTYDSQGSNHNNMKYTYNIRVNRAEIHKFPCTLDRIVDDINDILFLTKTTNGKLRVLATEQQYERLGKYRCTMFIEESWDEHLHEICQESKLLENERESEQECHESDQDEDGSDIDSQQEETDSDVGIENQKKHNIDDKEKENDENKSDQLNDDNGNFDNYNDLNHVDDLDGVNVLNEMIEMDDRFDGENDNENDEADINIHVNNNTNFNQNNNNSYFEMNPSQNMHNEHDENEIKTSVNEDRNKNGANNGYSSALSCFGLDAGGLSMNSQNDNDDGDGRNQNQNENGNKNSNVNDCEMILGNNENDRRDKHQRDLQDKIDIRVAVDKLFSEIREHLDHIYAACVANGMSYTTANSIGIQSFIDAKKLCHDVENELTPEVEYL